ncbi:MAG TPA: protein-methionine-sulfoxide reductase heme-binding subunit MsrQ [Candidatus Methylomirabilis sp.]|nr:protein-methionine-sulfoxide reductase heme-binding subunit MsrQ [Candidatus Methylomirabilis sp.]
MPRGVRVLLKAAVWVASLWPLGVLVRGWLADDLTANPIDYITRVLGFTALTLLLASLGMTPLRIVFGWSWPIQLRRLLGLLAFLYVTLHFAVWIVLDHFFAWRRMGADVVKRPFITAGVLALLVLAPLAATSTQGMIRRLGGARWRLLHRLAYAAGVLGVLHFLWLAKKGRTTPFYFAIALGTLLGVRIWDWGRRRAARLGALLKHEGRDTAPRPSQPS